MKVFRHFVRVTTNIKESPSDTSVQNNFISMNDNLGSRRKKSDKNLWIKFVYLEIYLQYHEHFYL